MSRSLLLAFSAAMFLAPLAPAFADPYDSDVRSEVVRFGDLDLNYQPDAHVMVHRIHRAARHVCEPNAGVAALSDRVETQDCRSDAEERGVSDTNAPLVTAEYYGRNPQVLLDDEGYVIDKK